MKQLKRVFFGLFATPVLAIGLATQAMAAPPSPAENPSATLVTHSITQSEAKAIEQDPSTIKIASNAHDSAASAYGITFVWNAQQKDGAVVTVDALANGAHYNFDLMVQSSGVYSLVHVDQTGAFYLPKGEKNINMVYVANVDTAKVTKFNRYTTYVSIWNDWYLAYGASSTIGQTLSADGGLTHYYALLSFYGASSLPPYYRFDDGQSALFDYWADQLEVGLLAVGAIDAPLTGPIDGYVIHNP